MKRKFIIASLFVATLAMASCSKKTTTTDPAQLPEQSQKVVSSNFSSPIVSIEIGKDEETQVEEYTVTLDDGTVIEFKNDVWDEVTVPVGSQVPEYFVNPAIFQYVKMNHPQLKVIGIKKDKTDFDVKLSNDLGIEFDSIGAFIKYD